MFRPRESYDQRILSCDVTITPEPARLRFIHDVFGNCVGVADFSGQTHDLIFDSSVRLEHMPLPAFAGVDGEIEVYSGAMPFDYSPEDLPDLQQSMQRHYPDPEGLVDAWARRFVRPVGKTSLQSLLSEMTQAIYADFKYRTRLEKGAQTPLETLASRSGSCRDYAVLMMEAVRSLGLAAAGWSSIPPTASSAIPTWCGWPWPAIPARPRRCTARGRAKPPTISAWTSPSMSAPRRMPAARPRRAPSGSPARAFSSEVDAGSREENATKQRVIECDRFNLKRSHSSSSLPGGRPRSTARPGTPWSPRARSPAPPAP